MFSSAAIVWLEWHSTSSGCLIRTPPVIQYFSTQYLNIGHFNNENEGPKRFFVVSCLLSLPTWRFEVPVSFCATQHSNFQLKWLYVCPRKTVLVTLVLVSLFCHSGCFGQRKCCPLVSKREGVAVWLVKTCLILHPEIEQSCQIEQNE